MSIKLFPYLLRLKQAILIPTDLRKIKFSPIKLPVQNYA
jgi:hypothetical protein